jgi:hypothetical protein
MESMMVPKGLLWISILVLLGAIIGKAALGQETPNQYPGTFGKSPAVQPQQPSPLQLRFKAVDFRALEAANDQELLNAINTQIREDNTSASSSENSSRLESLNQSRQFLEQALQYHKFADGYGRNLATLSDLRNLSNGDPDELQMRLDVAKQRWSVIKERITLVEARMTKSESNERTMRDFVQDNSSLDQYLRVRAEWMSQRAEVRMLQAEMAVTNKVLDELPVAIRKLRQLRQLQQGEGGKLESGTNQIAPVNFSTVQEKTDEPKADATTSPPPPPIPTADTTTSIKERITKVQELTKTTDDEKVSVATKVETLNATTASLREKFERIGLTEGKQMLLLATHRKLPSEAEFRIQNNETRGQIKDVNLELLQAERTLEEEKERLTTLEDEPTTAKRKAQTIENLESAKNLVAEYNNLHNALIELAAEREKMIAAIKDQRYFLDNKLLWVKNAEPLGLETISGGSEGIWKLAQPLQWIRLVTGLGERMVNHPLDAVGWIVGLLSLRWLSRKLSRVEAATEVAIQGQ